MLELNEKGIGKGLVQGKINNVPRQVELGMDNTFIVKCKSYRVANKKGSSDLQNS